MAIDQALEAAPDQGEYVLTIPDEPLQPKRDAAMRVKYVTADVLPPKAKRPFLKAQRVSVVHTCEAGPPADQEPVDWKLWGSRPVENLDQALPTIERYNRRRVIERLRFTLKTGVFDVERLRFDDCHTLANAVAFYCIAAWNALSLVCLSREDPAAPAEGYVDRDHLVILRHCAKKPVTTILEAVKAIAELAG